MCTRHWKPRRKGVPTSTENACHLYRYWIDEWFLSRAEARIPTLIGESSQGMQSVVCVHDTGDKEGKEVPTSPCNVCHLYNWWNGEWLQTREEARVPKLQEGSQNMHMKWKSEDTNMPYRDQHVLRGRGAKQERKSPMFCAPIDRETYMSKSH